MAGKLNTLFIKSLSEPGRYGDGGGLWLQVRDAKHRSWLFRYKLHGRARQMGLGPYPDTGLAEAREEAASCRKLVRQKIDPIDQRREAHAAAAAKAGALTFRQVAEKYIAAHEAGWRNAKHRYQWTATLESFAYPVFGDRPVTAIETGDVMRAIEPIWATKAETAARLRGRIETVLDFAAARGWRTGDNPARWRGHIAHMLPARSKIAPVEHHAALPWQEIGAFMSALRAIDSVTARALEFTILTGVRSGETFGATWGEIDLKASVWTIPGSRMKAGAEHRVPLPAAALVVLEAMRPLSEGDDSYVFPGSVRGRPLSNMAMTMLVRRMGFSEVKVHGFRSTFRDWAAEQTNFPREIAEAALAHTLRDKTEAAYRRGDALEKRRQLMTVWAEFCGVPPAATKAA